MNVDKLYNIKHINLFDYRIPFKMKNASKNMEALYI